MERLYKGLDSIKNYFHTSNQQHRIMMTPFMNMVFQKPLVSINQNIRYLVHLKLQQM